MAIISLGEWAEKNGIKEDSARQRANRGTLPAFKIGHNWVIDENVPNIDNRVGGLSKRWKKEN